MWHDKSKYLNCVARYRATVRKLVESFEFGVIISNDSSFLFAGLWTRHSISNDSSFLFAGTSGILNHYATSWIIWEFWFSILSRFFCFLLQMNAHPVYADSIKFICYMCWIMFLHHGFHSKFPSNIFDFMTQNWKHDREQDYLIWMQTSMLPSHFTGSQWSHSLFIFIK